MLTPPVIRRKETSAIEYRRQGQRLKSRPQSMAHIFCQIGGDGVDESDDGACEMSKSSKSCVMHGLAKRAARSVFCLAATSGGGALG